MIYRLINIPVFLEIGEGVVDRFDDILRKNNVSFEKPLVLSGPNSSKVLEKTGIFHRFDKKIISSSETGDLLELKSSIYGKGYDLLIAAGGGRVIDSGKFLSVETTLPVIAIPTILASDSVSSPISILKENGKYRSLGTVMPTGVIIDLDIVKKSPQNYTKAGLGDLMSNISASFDWELAFKRGVEKIDNFSRLIALMPAEKILANSDVYNGPADTGFLRDLAEGLVLSGISMGIAGSSRPASGSEHNISHSLDRLLMEKRKLHGLQVGFATLLTLILQDQREKAKKLLGFYKRMKFPVNPLELGIDCETLKRAIEIAPRIRERYTILNETPEEKRISVLEEFCVLT